MGQGQRCVQATTARSVRCTLDWASLYLPPHIHRCGHPRCSAASPETTTRIVWMTPSYGDSWYGRRIIPGLLTGSMLTHIGGLLGFLSKEMHFEFVAPVFPGDTITCTVTIAEKNAETHTMICAVQCTNEAGTEVLRARFSGFPSHPRLAC